MAASSNKTFWGFLFYLKHNPFKSVEAMTWPDLFECAKLFAAVNATAQTLTAGGVLTDANEGFGVVDFSTDIDFPKKGAGDGAGVAPTTTLSGNKVLCEQALYPEQHFGS
jgi:hypothetical protein